MVSHIYMCQQQRDAADIAGTVARPKSVPKMEDQRPAWEVFGLTLLLLTTARVRGVPWVLGNLPYQWWSIRMAEGIPINPVEMLMAIGRMLDSNSRKVPFRLIPRLRRNMCLARTLLAAWYSHKMGFSVSLHFGVRISAGGVLKGHSWVTLTSGPIWQDETFAEISQWHSDGSGFAVFCSKNTVERAQ
jgi:hypothetical protein